MNNWYRRSLSVPTDNEKRGNPLFANTAKVKPQVPQEVEPVPPEKETRKRSEPVEEVLPSSQVRHREVREIPFEEAYKRETVYFDKELKKKFDSLARERRKSKTELVNEAIADLIKKYSSR